MVATNPSEDAELQTTRLWTTSIPCLGLILWCCSFHTQSFPFVVYVSLFLTLIAHMPFYSYIFDVDTHPYFVPDSFLLFSVVLLIFYSHDIALPLFLLIHLSHDPTFCLLIIPTLLIAFVSLWARLLRILTHPDSIVVQNHMTSSMMSWPLLYIRYQSMAE